jgi:hypothetical protein
LRPKKEYDELQNLQVPAVSIEGEGPNSATLSLALGSFSQNVPDHLLTLESRSIIGPAEQALWPNLEVIEWHHKNVFRWPNIGAAITIGWFT